MAWAKQITWKYCVLSLYFKNIEGIGHTDNLKVANKAIEKQKNPKHDEKEGTSSRYGNTICSHLLFDMSTSCTSKLMHHRAR